MPRVLFSTPECRAVVIELANGEELGEHHVRERSVLQVISGRVSIECADETAECEAGALMTLDPGEHHTIRALADAELLLLLAPWPGGENLPANAAVEPLAATT